VAAPREVYRRPVSSYVAGFVGEINRWPATVVSADAGVARFTSPLGELSASDAETARVGEQGWIGIRPEHVTLNSSGDRGVPGIVQDLVHLGSRIECRLTVADGPLTATLTDEQATGLAIGQPVQVHLPAEKLRWLPR
jgi:iron(III) transport system ATP-binding protein